MLTRSHVRARRCCENHQVKPGPTGLSKLLCRRQPNGLHSGGTQLDGIAVLRSSDAKRRRGWNALANAFWAASRHAGFFPSGQKEKQRRVQGETSRRVSCFLTRSQKTRCRRHPKGTVSKQQQDAALDRCGQSKLPPEIANGLVTVRRLHHHLVQNTREETHIGSWYQC